MIFYHVGAPGLTVAQVLQPGHFSLGLGQPSGSSLMLREAIFDAVRRCEFPGRVSRLACVFGAQDLDAARLWAPTLGDTVVVYEADGGDAPSHVGHGRWLDGAIEIPCDIGHWIRAARGYWAGEPAEMPGAWEIIVGGPARILRVLDAS